MTGQGKQQGGPTPSSRGTISQQNFKRISLGGKTYYRSNIRTMMKMMAMISMMMFMVMVMMMKIWLD